MTTIYIASKDGYISVNGKLTAYKFNSAKVNFANGMVEYNCILGGEETTFSTDKCMGVYKSEQHYQQDVREESKELTYASAVRSAFFYVRDNVNANPQIPAFQIHAGNVVECYLPMDNFLYDSNYRTEYVGEGKYYKCRDEALLYCDIIKVEPDGTEVVCPSPAKRVALNDEQMTALKALEDAFKVAKDLGVAFAVNTCNDAIYAYSDKDVKGRTWDCRSESICEYGFCINDLMTEMHADVVGWAMDDTALYVEFK